MGCLYTGFKFAGHKHAEYVGLAYKSSKIFAVIANAEFRLDMELVDVIEPGLEVFNQVGVVGSQALYQFNSNESTLICKDKSFPNEAVEVDKLRESVTNSNERSSFTANSTVKIENKKTNLKINSSLLDVNVPLKVSSWNEVSGTYLLDNYGNSTNPNTFSHIWYDPLIWKPSDSIIKVILKGLVNVFIFQRNARGY